MGTQMETVNTFIVGEADGRTPEPLDILGQKTLVKLASSDTAGSAAVFHLTVPPMSGPPLHRHSREDEWFYVLEGTITVEIDGGRSVLKRGGSAFAPRRTVHAFQNFTAETGKILVMTTPGTISTASLLRCRRTTWGLPRRTFRAACRS